MRLATVWRTIYLIVFLARPVYMGRLSQMKKTMGSIPVPVADNPVRKPLFTLCRNGYVFLNIV